MPPSVTFVGKQGSGKSSLSKVLVENYGYKRLSWADAVRDVWSMAYGPITDYKEMKATLFPVKHNGEELLLSGGRMLQLLGTEGIRQTLDEEFWIKVVLRKLDTEEGPWCIDDTRFKNEAELLEKRCWKIINVWAPAAVRRDRLGATLRPEGHASEIEIDEISAHMYVTNDGSKTPNEIITSLATFIGLP